MTDAPAYASSMSDLASTNPASRSPQRRINRRTFAAEIGELLIFYIGIAVIAITAHQQNGPYGEHLLVIGLAGASWGGAGTLRWAMVARLRDLDRPARWSVLPLIAWLMTGLVLSVEARVAYETDGSLIVPLAWIWIAPAALFAVSLIALLLWPGTGDNRYAAKPQPRIEWLPWRANRATYAADILRTLAFASLFTGLAYLWVGRGGEFLPIHICLAVFNLALVARLLTPRLRDAESSASVLIFAIVLIAAAETLRVWVVLEGEWRTLALAAGLWAAALVPPAFFPSAGPNEYGPIPRRGVEWGKLFFWFSPWPKSAIRQRLQRRPEPLAQTAQTNRADDEPPSTSPPAPRS